MPFTAGTVAEYDLLVQITDKNINDQLCALYWTEVDSSTQPLPDTSLDGAPSAPCPREGYLIRHDLVINAVRKGKINPRCGIFAHITCPTISFPDRPTARLNFKFGRINPDGTVDCPTQLDPNKTPSGADSFLKSQEIDEGEIVDVLVSLNGFSMSFSANLGRKDFMEVANRLLPFPFLSFLLIPGRRYHDRSKSKSETVALPDKICHQIGRPQSDNIFSFNCFLYLPVFADCYRLRVV